MENLETELKIHAQKLIVKAQELIEKTSPNQLYAAIAVIIFTVLLFIIVRLFKRDGSSHQGTVTSVEPNEGIFVLHSEAIKKGKIKPIHVVNVPGHSRLRTKLDDYVPKAAGIVFVVDAVEFLPNCHAAIEYLYEVLTSANVVNRKIPGLILCNKVEKVTAHTKEFIRKQLEKEIDKLRASRTAVSEADVTNEFTLGTPGEPFNFSQCLNQVTIGEASGSTADVLHLEDFIRGVLKP
ncbi:OLC1v1023993C1 [Oldenlandia corymbosa var. corymbosa]|uniref:Signal recognition particle receptor subunit beta n=1 Tax=Oldenlandia corymbosa var. corymbosa TaxID=529605 RepID=A0AAV1C253_OLDCO|nr:OLC1v1023993C1 [Oldenlandia corymbosa var. corymbosa]